MYFIQIGDVEIPEFIITTNVYESAGYTWIEVKEQKDEEIHVYEIK